MRSRTRLFLVSAMTALLLAAPGCRKAEVQVYEVPKNATQLARPLTQTEPAAQAPAPAEVLPLQWTPSPAWTILPPTEFRKGNYTFEDESGSVEITVTSFPGETGGLAANANRWLRQASLPEIGEAELAQLVSEVELPSGATASVLDLKAKSQDPSSQRVYAAVLPYEGQSWFFKLSGPFATVQNQIPAFGKMMRSVRFTSDAPAPALDPLAEEEHLGDLAFDTPAGWVHSPGNSMRIASLAVQKEGYPTADFAITSFPGDTGGLVANVNRWRGQIGLPAWSAEQVQAAAENFTNEAGLAFTYFELKSQGAERAGVDERILAAIMEYAGRSWFFKLRGDALLLELQDEEFKALLQSVHFSHEGHDH